MKKLMTLLALSLALFAQDAIQNAELIVEKEKDELRQKFLLKVDKDEAVSDTLTMVAQGSGKKEELITLYDNGTHGDEVAGDGIFTGVSYAPPGTKRRFFLRGLSGGQTDAVFFEAVLFRW